MGTVLRDLVCTGIGCSYMPPGSQRRPCRPGDGRAVHHDALASLPQTQMNTEMNKEYGVVFLEV